MTNDPSSGFDSNDDRRPRRISDAQTEEITFPLAWVVVGGLAALIVIGLLGLGVVNIFRQQSITPTPQELPPLVQDIPTPAGDSNDQVAVITATIESAGETTSGEEQPPADSATTPSDQSSPGEITVDGYVKVVGTDGVGVSMRAGPGTNNARVGIAEENDEIVLQVLSGPNNDENNQSYVWWFVRHPDGTEGWVAQDFITPAPAP